MPCNDQIPPSLPLVEEILSEWKPKLGKDFVGYRNHVYRMLHCCLALYPCSEVEEKKLTIAACFHDIGIWSKGTVDYLPPSILEAEAYLSKSGLDDWKEEIRLLIDLHHKIRPIDQSLSQVYPLIEVFRRADLADFSLGLVLGGVPRQYMKRLMSCFPNAGFHKLLIKLAAGWFARNPLSPPPFIKW